MFRGIRPLATPLWSQRPSAVLGASIGSLYSEELLERLENGRSRNAASKIDGWTPEDQNITQDWSTDDHRYWKVFNNRNVSSTSGLVLTDACKSSRNVWLVSSRPNHSSLASCRTAVEAQTLGWWSTDSFRGQSAKAFSEIRSSDAPSNGVDSSSTSTSHQTLGRGPLSPSLGSAFHLWPVKH